MYFGRWCNVRGVDRDIEKLRQVILIKEFKRRVRDDSGDIKTHLDEQIVENLQKQQLMITTHKSTFNKNKSCGFQRGLNLK